MMGAGEEEYLLSSYSASRRNTVGSLYGATMRTDMSDREPLKQEQSEKKIGLSGLYSYMSCGDKTILIIGTVTAIIHGAGWPSLAFVFGLMTDTLLIAQQELQVPSGVQNGTDVGAGALPHHQNSITGISAIDVNLPQNSSLDRLPDTFDYDMTIFVLVYVFLGIVVLVTAYFQTLCWQLNCEYVMYHLQQDFFYHILRQDALSSSRHNERTIATLMENLKFIRESIGLRSGACVQYASTLLFSIAIGLWRQWMLMGLAVALVPLWAIPLGLVGKHLDINVKLEKDATEICRHQVQWSLERIKNVLVWMGQITEIEKYQTALHTVLRWSRRRCLLYGLNLSIVVLVFFLTNAFLFWFGIWSAISDDNQEVGRIFTVVFCLIIASISTSYLLNSFQTLKQADAAWAHIFAITSSVPDIDPCLQTGIIPESVNGIIQFSNVTFSQQFESISKNGSLRQFTIKFPPNCITAIVGSEESGKQLLKHLLMRFYDPAEGEIYLDKYDLRTLNVHWLRTAVSIIEKEPKLLSCSVFENIVVGLDRVVFEDVLSAAKATGAHDFILSLPQGYATQIGDRTSITLSPGVKQLLEMVRTVLQKPKIIILDELDGVTDPVCYEALQTSLTLLRPGKTILLLARNLCTVKHADHVVVLQDGWLVAEGNYEDVMKKINGLFMSAIMDPSDQLVTHTVRSKSKVNPLRQRRMSPWLPPYVDTEKIEEKSCRKVFCRIFRSCRQDWALVVSGSVFAAIFGLTSPASAYFLSELFVIFSEPTPHQFDYGLRLAIAFMIIAVISGISYYLRTVLLQIAGVQMICRLRTQAYSRILRQSYIWFQEENHQPSTVAAHLGDNTLVSTLNEGFGNIISMSVSLVFGITLGMMYGWQLGGALILSFLIVVVIGLFLLKLVQMKRKVFEEYMNEANLIISRSVNKLWTVQIRTLERRVLEAYVDKLTVPYFLSRKHAQLYAVAFSVIQTMMYLVYAAVFFLGSILVQRHLLMPADVLRVFFLIAVSMVSLMQLLRQWHLWQRISSSANTFLSFVDLKDHVTSPGNALNSEVVEGLVSVKGVYFSHATKLSVPLLQELNFDIKPKQMVTIVGDDGSCKTVLELLIGFYEPLIGQITVDNFPVSEMSTSYLRSIITLVSEPLILPGTLYENLTYGQDPRDVDGATLDEAVRLSGVGQFLWQLPHGWNTKMDEIEVVVRVVDQFRIALARYFIRATPILLLDNLFDKFDSKDTQVAIESFTNITQGRTCIVVTKREPILEQADWVVLIENGTVVEQGRHQDLLAKRGVYYKVTNQN